MTTEVKRRRFNFFKSKLPFIVMVVILLYIGVSLGFQLSKLWAMQSSIEEMEDQVVEMQGENAHLWERLEVLESEGYVEETARDRLGLIKPGEKKVVPVEPPGDH